MPLIQRYRYLDRSNPVAGSEIILYRKDENKPNHYTKYAGDPLVVKKYSKSGSLILSNSWFDMTIPQTTFDQYRYILVPKLNLLQKIFGKHYLGIPLLLWIIYVIIKTCQ